MSLMPERTFESHWKLLEAAKDRIAVADTLPGLIDVVRTTVRAVCSADGVTFVLREGDQCHYVEEDAIAPLWKGQRFAAESCICGWCMAHGETAAVEDVFADPRIPHDLYRRSFVKSLIVAPLRTQAVVAAIGTYWAQRRRFQPREIATVEALAGAVGDALRQARVT